MNDIDRLDPTARYAEATTFRGLVHAVEVPAAGTSGIEAQTRSLLAALEVTLERAGSGRDRLLIATVYLTDIEADYAGMNTVWEAWLPAGNAPARACVEVRRLADPAWRIEIAALAAQR